MAMRTTPSAFKRVFIGDDDDYATQVPNEDLLHVAGWHGPIVRVSSEREADTVTIASRLRHTGAWLSDYQRTPEWHGAIGDGNSHPAGTALGVTTLAELQILFPFAESLADEMDWLGIQAALYAGGIVKGRPCARYVLNKTLFHPNGLVQPDFTHCSLSWESMAAIPDDGTNLAVNGDFSGADTSMWVNTLLWDPATGIPPTPFTFTGGAARWVDGAIGSGPTHFGQFGQQMHIPKGKWTVEATITLSEGLSRGYYGPPYCGFAFAIWHVGQGFPSWPDPLAKNATLSPGKDGVPTYLSFDFEIEEEEGRTLWLTFSGGNCDIEVDNVRVKPFRMNYAVWCSGDPMEFTGYDVPGGVDAMFRYDESAWTGGVLLGPNPEWSTIYTGPDIGGFLHKSFRGDGARCNWVGAHVRKFQTGFTMGDNAYLNRWESTTIGFCQTCVKYIAGAINAAENYRFTNCVLFNSELAVHAQGGGEWFFFGTSLDYCRKFLRAERGAYIVCHGVHIEGHQAETYLPVSSTVETFEWHGDDTPNIITGATSGATARFIRDKSGETWDEGPRIVVQHISGTFQSGETITGSIDGEAVLSGPIVMGDFMFDLTDGSLWSMVSGEVLFTGYTHNGAEYVGRVESNSDRIAFGNVWLYNLDAASGVTWKGAGRVTVDHHLGPVNPNLAALWIENHNSDAYGGMGDFTATGDGGLPGMTLTDALPADGIPLDFYLRADGMRASRSSYAPDGPTVTLDTGVSRITDGASLRVDVPATYGSGQSLGLRFLIPVREGKIVMDRYYLSKPGTMPDVTHGPYVLGTPVDNTASISTTGGMAEITLSHDYVDGLASGGVQADWTVTFAGLTGSFGGIPAADINGTRTITDVTEEGIVVAVGSAAADPSTTTLPSGVTITYVQTNFLVWDRRLWVKVTHRDPDGIPTIVQDLYQGELNYTVPFAAEDWRKPAEDGNRWWYTEVLIPDSDMDRMGSGRAPEWATHMLVDLNFWNLLYAVSTPPAPPIYLAGFFANVV